MKKKSTRHIIRKLAQNAGVLKKSLGTAAILASFGAVVYFKNRVLHKYADDYPYSFVWEGDENGNLAYGDHKYQRVRTAGDLLKSQASHYMTWDGRSIAETLVQLFLMSDDKKPYDRANTAVLMSQLMLIAALGKGRTSGPNRMTPAKAFLLAAGFYVSAPHLIATCFWLTGSMNYMWMGLLQSMYILPYSMHYFDRIKGMPRGLAFILGLLGGWSTETGSGGAMMFTGMATMYAMRHHRYAPWMGWGLAGCVLGMMLLLLAPGNRKKFAIEAQFSETLPEVLEESLPGYIPAEYVYTPIMFKKWFIEGFMATALRELPLQIPVLLYFFKGKDRDRQTDLYVLGLEAVTWAIPSVMMLMPEYPRRSTYPSVIYVLAAALCSVDHLDIKPFGESSTLMKLLDVSVVSGFALILLASLIVDSDISCQMDRQINYILAHKDSDLIYVEDVCTPGVYERIAGDRSLTWDVTMGVCLDNVEDPYNKAAAAYFGTGQLYTDTESDDEDMHVYEAEDRSSKTFGVINPLKSFIYKIKEVVFGISDVRELGDTIKYPVVRYGSHPGGHYVYERPLKQAKTPVVYSFGTETDSSFLKTMSEKIGAPVRVLSGADAEQGRDDGTFGLKAVADAERHDHVDLLTVDADGVAFGLAGTIRNVRIPIDQICVKLRGERTDDFDGRLTAFMDDMHGLGYVIIYADKRSSRYTFLKRETSGREV